MSNQNLYYGYRFSNYTTFLIGIKKSQIKLLETKSCVINRIPTNLT